MDGAARLRKLISGGSTLVAPGVFNPAVALLAQKVGFKVLYFSGAAFSNSMGLPDLGVTTLSEVARASGEITERVEAPLIVDADTGFGESVNVMRSIRELRRAGAAAVQVEDQVMPKKCGHLEGKELTSMEEMVKKVIAAKEESRGSPMIIARTDARAVEGIDEAVSRGRAYERAGADIIFPEALQSRDEFEEFRRKIKVPLLANMTEFGKTPYMDASDFEGMRYNIVIFPVTAFRAMMKSVQEALKALKTTGSQRAILGDLMTRDEFYRLIDYYSFEKTDKRVDRAARRLIGARD